MPPEDNLNWASLGPGQYGPAVPSYTPTTLSSFGVGNGAPSTLPGSVAGGGMLSQADFLAKQAGPAGGIGGSAWGQGLGFNVGSGQLAIGGLGAAANLWNGMQANGLARDQLALTKRIGLANLNNQVKTLNTRLEDRARARGITEGQSQSQVDDYVNRNRLSA